MLNAPNAIRTNKTKGAMDSKALYLNLYLSGRRYANTLEPSNGGTGIRLKIIRDVLITRKGIKTEP